MRVKVKRAGHEVARGHDRWHIDCVDAMTRPAGTRESTPGPTSDSLGSAWRRAGQRQELRDGRVFGVRQSSVCSRGLYNMERGLLFLLALCIWGVASLQLQPTPTGLSINKREYF